MTNERFFIEVESYGLSEKGQIVSGDVAMQRRDKGRVFVVLSDGEGSGVKANVTANVIGSMALHYTLLDEPAEHAARSIIHTFMRETPGDGEHATFTILDIHNKGTVNVVEFDNPFCIVLRGNNQMQLDRKKIDVETDSVTRSVFVSRFEASPEDRIVLTTDGITQSGNMTKRMPDGWGRSGVEEFCRDKIAENPTVSAYDLSRAIVAKAELNDLFAPKNDMTCEVIYFRTPRRILICSGPPYNEKKDEILADMVSGYDGTKLICGGTTAQIISRELKRSISVELKRDPAGLPPTSMMEGVDLITEGVLTLSKVKTLLERNTGDITQKGTDGVVARMLQGHDIVEFVVGTRINPVHQDPNLPVELELRRNLIKDLARLLETKYMKEVKIQYI